MGKDALMTHRQERMDFAYRNNPPPHGRTRPNRLRPNRNQIIRRWCAIALVAEGVYFLLCYPGFWVRNVRIEGLRTLSPLAVAQAAHVPRKTNIFMMALRVPIVQRVQALPLVDHARRMLRLPNTIVLYVTERTPVAVLQTNSGFWLMDSNRVPYKEVSGPQPGLPTIQATGEAALASVKIGQSMSDDWIIQTYYLLSLLVNKQNLQPKLITVDQNANLCLNRQDNLRVNIGTPDDLPAKLYIADQTLRAGGPGAGSKLAYIDVSCPSQPALMPRVAQSTGHV